MAEDNTANMDPRLKEAVEKYNRMTPEERQKHDQEFGIDDNPKPLTAQEQQASKAEIANARRGGNIQRFGVDDNGINESKPGAGTTVVTPIDRTGFSSPYNVARAFSKEELGDLGKFKAASLVRPNEYKNEMFNLSGSSNMKKEDLPPNGPNNRFGQFTSRFSVIDPNNPQQMEAAKFQYGIDDAGIERLNKGEVFQSTAIDKTFQSNGVGGRTLTFNGTNSYLMTPDTLNKTIDEAKPSIERYKGMGIQVDGSPVTETYYTDKEGKESGNKTFKKDEGKIPDGTTVQKPTAMGKAPEIDKNGVYV